MNEDVLLFIVFLAAAASIFAALKIAVRHEKKHQEHLDELRRQISQWPHEKLVFVWGEYNAICSVCDAGVPPPYFEMLELLEDECERRKLK
ncbi:MAG: hypothetical protein IJ482_07675 [Alphaproteobacteria bacterium]|nr:hypothetical protein [Alphaproteobacteria bacterium]